MKQILLFLNILFLGTIATAQTAVDSVKVVLPKPQTQVDILQPAFEPALQVPESRKSIFKWDEEGVKNFKLQPLQATPATDIYSKSKSVATPSAIEQLQERENSLLNKTQSENNALPGQKQNAKKPKTIQDILDMAEQSAVSEQTLETTTAETSFKELSPIAEQGISLEQESSMMLQAASAPAPSTACAVGKTEGFFDVSATGAANYSIPIYTPKGVGEMVPNISLVYNSQGGMGPLGKGWGISGLSAISRMGKTHYLDGKVQDIQFNNTDHFVLDGQVLIPISGANGGNGTEYRTENESFIRVFSYGTLGNGPAYFEVLTKDGKRLIYGNNEYSRMTLTNKTEPLAWTLIQAIDADGNYIFNSYGKDPQSGDFLIVQVLYTGNVASGYTTLTPNNYMQFEYEETNLFPTQYVQGVAYKKYLRLKKIMVYVDNRKQHEYILDYTTNALQTEFYLTKVTEYNGYNEKYNSVTFEWEQEIDGYTNPVDNNAYKLSEFGWDKSDEVAIGVYAHVNKMKQLQRLLGDINGDGLDDIVEIQAMRINENYKGVMYSDVPYSAIRISLANGNGYNAQQTFVRVFDTQVGYDGDGSVILADMNLDGKAELVLFRKNSVVDVYGFNGSSFTKLFSQSSLVHSECVFSPSGCVGTEDVKDLKDYCLMSLADINGDGLPDLVYFDLDYVKTFLNTGRGFAAKIIHSNLTYTKQTGGFNNYNHRRILADINGDGLPDLVCFGGSDLYVALNTGTTFEPKGSWLSTFCNGQDYQPYRKDIQMVDMNGDGKADIVVFDESDIKVSLATGNGFSTNYWTRTYDQGESILKNKHYTTTIMDINNDGFPDILMFTSGGLVIYHNTGKGLNAAIGGGAFFRGCNDYGKPDDETGIDRYPRLFSDANGDGAVDFTGFSENGMATYLGFAHFPKKIVAFNDGLGNQTQVNYAYRRSTLAADGIQTYPYTILGAPKMMVASSLLKSPARTAHDFKKTYSFEKPITHLKGKGFLGFSKIVSTDYIILPTLYNTAVEVGNSAKNFTFYSSGNTIIGLLPTYETNTNALNETNSISNTYAITYGSTTQPSKVALTSFLERNQQENKVLYKYTFNTFDTYGNTIKTYTIYQDNCLVNSCIVAADSTVVSYTTIGNWNFKPTRVQSYASNMTELLKTKDEKYTYIDHHLSKKTSFPDNSLHRVEEKYENYNRFGSPQTATLTPYEGGNSITQFEYDNSGRFCTKVTNALGHVETYNYNSYSGTLNKTIDANELGTNYVYDNWDRPLRTYNADGFYTYYSIQWANNAVPGALYYTTETPGTEYPTETYYNALGQAVEKVYYAVNNGSSYDRVHVRTEYDFMGNIYRVSAPFKENTSPDFWSISTYDLLGRIKTVEAPYANKEYTYGTRMVTETDLLNNTTNTKKYNAIGQLTEATDLGGTIGYTYNAMGLPITMTTNNQTVTLNYDAVGNRTSINDPNSGVTTSTYNSLGQLTRQTDAKGKWTTYGYDKLGRTVQKWVIGGNLVEGSATYTYDVGNKAKGKLSSVSSYTHTTAYTYDNTGHLYQTTQTIDGTTFNTQYLYDTKGRLNRMIYPGGYEIRYSYKPSSNQLDAVKNAGGNTLYKFQAGNIYGQPTQVDFSSGISTLYTYNSSGMLTGIKTHRAATGLNLAQNLEYGYNSRGLMSYRKDIKNNQSEEFLYDNLARLTQDKRLKGGYMYSNPITYDNIGNIKNQKTVGDYEYASAGHANAVSKLQTPYITYEADCETSFTPFNKVKKITEGSKSIDLFYGNDQQRIKSIHKVGSTTQTNYYVNSDYEEENLPNGNVRKLHYLRANGKLFAIFVKETGKADSTFYVHTDHLGSYDVITDCNMNIRETYAFDAWGFRRKNADWTKYETRTSFFFKRGFTEHEHYDGFDIINMNGRLYDPANGRFFSPDPFVADATSTQDFNRYSYARNNPIMYTDPDGEFIQYIIGGVFGGINGYAIGESLGKKGWALFGYTVGGAAIGVATAGIGTYATSYIGTAINVSGAAATVIGGSLAGGVNSIGFAALSNNWENGNWAWGFVTGAVSSGISGLAGSGTRGAFVGGFAAGAIGSYANGERNAGNILLSALVGGGLSAGSYELTTAYGYYKNGWKNDLNISYKEYKTILRATQQSFFYGIEYSVTSSAGKIRVYEGFKNRTEGSLKPGEAKFFYHSHQDVGYDAFSNPSQDPDNDISNYFNAVVNNKVGNYLNLLGTREGHLWYMRTPTDTPAMLPYNYNRYFYPAHLYFNLYR